MRKLLYAALGYTLALMLSHYLLPYEFLPYIALATAALSLAGLLFKGKLKLVWLIVLLAAAAGFIWNYTHEALIIRPAEKLVGTTQKVEARVTDYPGSGDNYTSLVVKLTGEGLPRCKVLVTDYENGLSALRPGDIVELELKFRSARIRYNTEDDYYLASGIFLRAYNEGEYTVISHRSPDFLDWPKELAYALKGHILELFPDDVAPLVKALLTGDKTELYDDDALYVALKIAGLSHIIAVSGMHVSFIIALLSLATGRRRMTAFLGIPLVWFFAAMMGFGPSVTRASVMISMLLTAPILRRENDSPTSLSAALLIILLANPQAIGSISLQLSFAAMVGIILVTPRIYRSISGLYSGDGLLRKAFSSINAVFSSSVGALVFTTPLVALHFGYVPLYSVLSNMLCLWAMSTAFMLSYPICIIGAVFYPLGEALAWLVAWLPRYTIAVIKLIARLPWAALYTYNNLIAWWLVFVYAVMWLPWLLRGKRSYRPIIPICCCLVTLPVVAYLSHSLSASSPGVTAVDVGQGQCIVATTANGTAVIDCGGKGSAANAGDAAAEYLLSSGRRSVELLVLTHLHDDHANGVVRLMNYLDVKRIALPSDCQATEVGDSILEMCYDRDTEIYYISENTSMLIDGLELQLFAPIGSEDPNEKGLIVYGDYGEFEFLVTGDAGSGTERQFVGFYPVGDIELLVVGHHGSKYSTSDLLLDSTTPDTAFISVGVNSYGHPTDEVLDKLHSRGIDVYRTDQSGNITIMAGINNG